MKLKYPLLLAFLSGVFIFLLIAGKTPADQIVFAGMQGNNTSKEEKAVKAERHPYYPAIKIPTQLEFAGEMVPLTDQEVRERLDREMLVNSYWHSQTLQNIKLANRWFPTIEKILNQQGIPEDFKYLAVAESGLRNVVSPAKATGVWQILKSTGQSYGLEISSEVDERYDVDKATVAATKYLTDAYEKFDNWTLAGASYNAGMSKIATRLKEQKVDNYYDLYLNHETSRYILRVLAFKLIYESHEKYGFILDDEDKYHPLDYYVIEQSKSIDNIADFAKSYNTTYKMVKYLNPWMRSPKLTVSNGKSYEVKLPKGATRSGE